jgi:formamidopyrimidine-DNA glycosylase
MPELPEVETTRKGIKPYLENTTITAVIIRNFSLRWPIENDLPDILTNRIIHCVSRRAKYLLIEFENGTLMIHLGMSGSLRILDKLEQGNPGKHDHLDIELSNGHILRYNDPRRFGSVLWTSEPINQHRLIAHLGPEPLLKEFNAEYLQQQAQSKLYSIKTLIMNGKIVVGVGNIYANESLFLAKIHPRTVAQSLSLIQYVELTEQIKIILRRAIKSGGTTLKDFTNSDGKPGYFAQYLNVYGRKGESCSICKSKIQHYKESQRATYYCPLCQPETN